jgi:opacity protein-like surface antigen
MLMRTYLRISLALLIALGLSSQVFAQSPTDRLSLNASVGPSFATLGTTFSTTAALDLALTDRVALVGEFGALPHAPFDDAAEIAPPVAAAEPPRVNAYHWNGNLKVQPFRVASLSPYVTAGVGSFTADAISDTTQIGGLSVQDRRRVSDFATNLGAGVVYRITDWVGVGADYRTFFVQRDGRDPRVHRFTTGISFSLK